ncbi:MAG TPA: hypothetical protein DCX06_07360 [Opitutae bacterium]|nr:hypothetical protein [Opitutae bacterium]
MFLAQLPTTQQMPPLPEGPSLDRVRGPVEVPLFETWQIVTVAIIGALLLGFLLWHFVRYLRECSALRAPLTPEAIALKQLDSTAQIVDDELFAVRTSAALKEYFQVGLNIPSKGRTSEEFIRSLKGNTRLNGSFQQTLKQFFADCDAIKFARQSSSPEQRESLTDTAKQLVQKAEQTKEVAQL